MQLTDRDRRVLRHLAAARWLSTGQVAALCFADVSRTMPCRRLRLMRGARFVRSVRENPMMEALHTLGARGREALAELGDERRMKPERFPPANRRHFMGINDIRVAVFRSAVRDGFGLDFFYASWELQERGWPYAVIPDAVAEVSIDGTAAAAVFEYDRATEGLALVVERKLKRYAQGLDGFAFVRVITVVDEERRRAQLALEASRKIGDSRFTFLLHEGLASWSAMEILGGAGSDAGFGEGSAVRTVLHP